MKSFRHSGHGGRGIFVVTIVATVAMLTSATTQAFPSRATAARTLNGSDTAKLHLVHQQETVLEEEGAATGGLPGRMKAEFTVGTIYTGRCTVDAAGGSITGHGTATPHGSGRYQSFSGTLLITGGSGRYAHVRGRAALYGTFDRRTFSFVIQTKGNLSY